MWVIGHTAIAYLLIKPIVNMRKKQMDPTLIIFIIFFANLIDFVHFGSLRNFSHSLIGTLLLTGVSLWTFKRLNLIEKSEFSIFLFVVGTHIIVDILFSTYNLLFPVNNVKYSIYGLNSPQDFAIESISVIIFIIVFVYSDDYLVLKTYITQNMEQFFHEIGLKAIFNVSLYPFYIFGLFYLFSIAQLGFFLVTFLSHLLKGYWLIWIFFLCFGSFVVTLTSLFEGILPRKAFIKK